jgi:lipopolysaccharide cholinephosphotransferase
MTSKKSLREHLYGLDFPTHPGYGRDRIQEVQGVVLDMGVLVCQILERHGLPYFITNGTLIGAALYESFVPWDDDFDLFLFDDTYDEAMRVLQAELPSHLIVHGMQNDPLYFPAWNRIKNIQSHALDSGLYNPDNRLLKYPCLSVDLYRIKKIPADGVDLYKVTEALAFFEKKRRFGIVNDDQYDAQVQPLLQKKSDLEARNPSGNQNEVYMFMVMLKQALLPSDIFPLKRYHLDGHSFWGPQSSDALLSSLYGPDYKTIPDYEQRNTRFSEVHWVKPTDL